MTWPDYCTRETLAKRLDMKPQHMPAFLKLTCGGCDAEAETEPLRRTFHSLNGSGHGFGRYVMPDMEAAAEKIGWTLYDVIGCTYCPECTKKIESSEAA